MRQCWSWRQCQSRSSRVLISVGLVLGPCLAQPVELFFSTLTRRLLRRGQFASRDELAAAIDTFVLAYDEHDAKPYRWTYDGSPLKAQ